MHIRPATAIDLPDIATIQGEAFIDDDLTAFLAPYCRENPGSLRRGFLLRTKKRFYSGKDMLVAVTDENDSDWDGVSRVIGHVALEDCRSGQEQNSWWSWFSWNALELQLLGLEDKMVVYLNLDKSASRANMLAYRASVPDRDPLAEFTDCWSIDMVVVSTSHQRRGVGKALVRWCQDIAQRDGVPLIVQASKPGAKLYKNLGFTSLGMVYQLEVSSEPMVWHPPLSTS